MEGELTAVIDGLPRHLSAGESAFLSSGIPHQLMNTSSNSSRYILIGTPARFDQFIREAAMNVSPKKVLGHRPPRKSSVS
nr:cupin domain-containing protein [Rhizobium grahamii]